VRVNEAWHPESVTSRVSIIALILFLIAVGATSARSQTITKGTAYGVVVVKGAPLTMQPLNMLCLKGAICGGYAGPVIFCRAVRGVMPTVVPCGSPSGETQTDSQGNYSISIPVNFYYVYLRGVRHPWTIRLATVNSLRTRLNFSINPITD
jgi:hypothetical protein